MNNSHEKKLTGTIVDVRKLDASLKDSMLELMQKFYYADEKSFLNDLANKDRVILLSDSSQKIQGFTSAKIFNLDWPEPVKIIFSGDTIIHPDFWGTLELPRTWGQFMLDTIAESASHRLFWFLISSGFRTYRFLPAYFNEFYPRFDGETPEEFRKILNAAAIQLFGESFNSETGIIKLSNPTPLKEIIAPPNDERRKNPHINFFLSKNPGYVDGDELACITELSLNNIKPFVKRLLRA